MSADNSAQARSGFRLSRDISVEEVRRWLRTPGKLSDDQCAAIALELTAMHWPDDPCPAHPSDDLPEWGNEVGFHPNVAKSISDLQAALPDTMRLLREHEFLGDESDLTAVEVLHAAIERAKPSLEKVWGSPRGRGRPKLIVDLHPTGHWRGASRKIRGVLVAHLRNAGLSDKFDRNSIGVALILAALKRMGFAKTDGLSASTLSQHLTKNNR